INSSPHPTPASRLIFASLFFVPHHHAQQDLHSLPPRRSSDLTGQPPPIRKPAIPQPAHGPPGSSGSTPTTAWSRELPAPSTWTFTSAISPRSRKTSSSNRPRAARFREAYSTT